MAFRELWYALEAGRAAMDEAMEAAARKIPVFAAIIATMPPEMRAAQQAHSTQLQREALLEGRWDRYNEDLATQGQVYAQMGIPFREWYPLIGAFRELLFADLPDDAERRANLIFACNALLDHAMSCLGEAYVEAKQVLVRKAEGQLRLHIDIVQRAPVGMHIYHWDDPPDPASFRLVASNPAATRIGSPPAVERWIACLRQGESQHWATSSGAGASTRTLETRCFGLGDDHVGVIVEDVTERQQMQDALARHLQELERSNRELDEFAYVASHDLKAPLQDVRNLSSWIREDLGDELPPASGRHVELLVDRVRRMERLLDDLLDYSRAGRPGQASESVPFDEVVADVVAFFGPPQGFTIVPSGTLPPMWTPRAPLEQVVRNLVGNALKHHDRREGNVAIAGKVLGERVAVCVSDDGPGIPAEFQERVWRMFQTLRPRDEVEGSGMGLAIVRKTVEAYGGSVTLASNGRGTAFTFTWPLRTEVGGR